MGKNGVEALVLGVVENGYFGFGGEGFGDGGGVGGCEGGGEAPWGIRGWCRILLWLGVGVGVVWGNKGAMSRMMKMVLHIVLLGVSVLFLSLFPNVGERSKYVELNVCVWEKG